MIFRKNLGGSPSDPDQQNNASSPMPSLPRIVSIVRLPDGKGGVINQAKLSSAEGVARVEWRSRKVDCRLRRGCRALPIRETLTEDGGLFQPYRLLPLLDEFLQWLGQQCKAPASPWSKAGGRK